MGLSLTLILVFGVTKNAEAKFFGWEKQTRVVAAFQDGTICETYNYYAFGIKVKSEVRCGPCCDVE